MYFGPEQLKDLRAINSDERGDSTFIMKVISFLYAERIETVKTKTACGRRIKGDSSKTMMTPETKAIVHRIYTERLNGNEMDLRMKKLNKLIKDAFSNISKSHQSNEICRLLKFDD